MTALTTEENVAQGMGMGMGMSERADPLWASICENDLAIGWLWMAAALVGTRAVRVEA